MEERVTFEVLSVVTVRSEGLSGRCISALPFLRDYDIWRALEYELSQRVMQGLPSRGTQKDLGRSALT